jgi:hypothetical protein
MLCLHFPQRQGKDWARGGVVTIVVRLSYWLGIVGKQPPEIPLRTEKAASE